MLKEEKVVRQWGMGQDTSELRILFFRDVTSLIRAVRRQEKERVKELETEVKRLENCDE